MIDIRLPQCGIPAYDCLALKRDQVRRCRAIESQSESNVYNVQAEFTEATQAVNIDATFTVESLLLLTPVHVFRSASRNCICPHIAVSSRLSTKLYTKFY